MVMFFLFSKPPFFDVQKFFYCCRITTIMLFICRFRKEWLHLREFHGWLSEGSATDRAYCTACNKELLAGKSELLKHAMGKKHKKRVTEGRTNMTVPPDLSSVLDETGMPHVLV